jgi:UDP-GlcNAc3NAcA epimerase
MSDIFFEEMSIPQPTFNLEVNGMGHGAMTGQMLEKIEVLLIKEKPDWVLVYGDTNSTLAGALAARKLNIRVAHVEAGLRSFNNLMPEEINRILTDRISDILFCPTDKAIKNLIEEGYDAIGIPSVKCGDVMQDAALFYSSKAKRPSFEIPEKFALCTIHRAENTDDIKSLSNIFMALDHISKNEMVVIVPLHPRTKAKLGKLNFDFDTTSIKFIDPVGYLEMVYLLKNCSLVLTDSGGLQKEAYFFEKNCVTLREETEWVELVENGFNVLAGANFDLILASYKKMIEKSDSNFGIKLYGYGNAGEVILNELIKISNK